MGNDEKENSAHHPLRTLPNAGRHRKGGLFTKSCDKNRRHKEKIFFHFPSKLEKILEINVVEGIRISDEEEKKIEEKIILLGYLQNTAICHEPLEIFFPFFICN